MITVLPSSAQVLALQSIVCALVAREADRFNQATGVKHQVLIDAIAEVCGDAIRTAEVDMSGPDADRYRNEAIKFVGTILNGVVFPPDANERH